MTLGYVARGLVQALGAHFLVSAILGVAVALLWQRVALVSARASVTSWRLFALRLLPAAGGLLASVLVMVGYVMWEVKVDSETVGPVALTAAAAGLATLLHAATRLQVVITRTVRIRRELAARVESTLPTRPLPASIIDTTFPVVAIVGLVASRLFVARSVVEACSAEEFDAVLAHECAHARQYDNLRRLAMAASPDLLSVSSEGRALETAWLQAAELAADEIAAAGCQRGVSLASALVKVARLAAPPVAPLPASALFRGEPIAERVHRLLDPPEAPEWRPWPVWARALMLCSALAAAVASLPAFHNAAELLLALGR
jgi:Zn-dependent protease with chaperone function